MNEELRCITVDTLIAVTGTGKRTTMRLIREGKLPGYFEGVHYICTPGEFDAWYAGKRTPRPVEPEPIETKPDHEPVDFVQRRKTA